MRKVLNPRVLYWKNDSGARELEQLPRSFPGRPSARRRRSCGFARRGIDFAAPLAQGQKTGWFYDQTANRALLGAFPAPGARVLDVCSYVGRVGRHGAQTWRRQRHLRGCLRGGAGVRAAQRRAQRRQRWRRCAAMPSMC